MGSQNIELFVFAQAVVIGPCFFRAATIPIEIQVLFNISPKLLLRSVGFDCSCETESDVLHKTREIVMRRMAGFFMSSCGS